MLNSKVIAAAVAMAMTATGLVGMAYVAPATAALHTAPTNAGKDVVATDRDNNETIYLHVGDTLVVRLTSNPSTNYSWKVAQINQAQLRLTGDPTYVRNTSGLMGAPGYEVFMFQARAVGGDTLGMLYQNPTLRGVQALHTFRLRVVISTNEPPPAGQGKTIVLTDEDNNEHLIVAEGDTLVVKLQSNPSTGYSWSVAENTVLVLKPEGDTYVRGANRPGASGTQQFTFKVVGAGEVSLRMLYQRPFQRSVQAGKTWQMFIESPRPGGKPASQPATTPSTDPVLYVCAGGANFSVVFGDKMAKVTYAETTKDLPQQESGDGFRYADDAWELRGNGKDATLTDLATKKPVGENCTAQPSAATSAPLAVLTTFTCKDNSVIRVSVSGDVAAVTYNDVTKTLKQTEAADGFAYADGSWELRGKGALVTLTDLSTKTVVQRDCLDLSKTDAGQNAPITFACADGTSFVVGFIPKAAEVTYNSQTQKLAQLEAADGFLYGNAKWELRGNGDDATLTDLASGKAVGTDCKKQ